MASNNTALLKERNSLRIWVIVLIVGACGIALLYLTSCKNLWVNNEVWQTVIREIASFLLVTVGVSLLWELGGKRAFLDEILSKAQISKEIAFAGIVKVTDSFHFDIDWKSYFSTVNKLDIFFAYAHTWRTTHLEELKKLAARDDVRIRVVLPDPEDEQTVAELARRFKYTCEELRKLIREAEADFQNLRSVNINKGAQINIWFLPAAPHFTFYRFDRVAIFALYTHRRERTGVPTFVVEMGGTLYDYIRNEFDAMISPGGLARSVTEEKR